MRKYQNVILYVSLIILVLSCGKDEGKVVIPKDILPKKKMMLILEDIHIAEAIVTNARYPNLDSSRVAFANLQKEVFKKHKVDSVAYAKSYSFYAKNPIIFKEIYKVVQTSLHQKDSLAEGISTDLKLDKKVLQDSLKKKYHPKDINIQKDIDDFKKKNTTVKELKSIPRR